VTPQLGDRIKDKITGLKGICVCVTTWLNGCVRVGLQPEELSLGKPAEVVYYDAEQTELVKAGVHKPVVLVEVPPPKPLMSRSGGPARESSNFRR